MTHMKFFADELTPELVEKAKTELGETEEIRFHALKEFKLLINDEHDLFPCMDDVFLLAFLRVKKFNISKAFKTLKNFYIHKAQYSGIFCDFKPSDLKLILEQGAGYTYGYRDLTYSSVGWIRVASIDIEKFTIEQSFAEILLYCEFLIRSEVTQIAGQVMIIDLSGCTWQIMKYYSSPSTIYKMAHILLNCLPVRVKGCHFINAPIYANAFFYLLQLLLPKKLSSRIYVHGKDLKSLHKYINTDILPEEYEGKLEPFSTHAKADIKYIFSQEDHFIKIMKYGFKGKTLQNIQKKK